MVDSLLEQFDVNEDGVLDFSEFMKSFVQARHDLGLLWANIYYEHTKIMLKNNKILIFNKIFRNCDCIIAYKRARSRHTS